MPISAIAWHFARQVARTPDALAVSGDGVALTYRDLDARSDHLARRLADLGGGPDGALG
jgi:non-ribosomal peptide synthetase component F